MDFKTADSIKLKPADINYGAAFKFPISSTASSNDGALPFGTTIDSVEVTGWENDTQVTDIISGTPTISGTDTVQVNLNYPTTTMSGSTRSKYMSLKFVLTLDNAAVLQADYDNVVVKV